MSAHGSLPSARLNTNASVFVPSRAKITIKGVDGHEVDLTALKKGSPLVANPAPPVSSNGSSVAKKPSVRLESEEDKRKRIAEEEAKQRAMREAEEKEKREKLEAEEKRKKNGSRK